MLTGPRNFFPLAKQAYASFIQLGWAYPNGPSAIIPPLLIFPTSFSIFAAISFSRNIKAFNNNNNTCHFLIKYTTLVAEQFL